MRRPPSPVALAHPSLKQSQGYNPSDVALKLIFFKNPKQPQKKKEKQRQQQQKLGKAMFILRLNNTVMRVYICIPWTADCSRELRHRGFSHENLYLIFAPFEENRGGAVQQSVMLLELTNVVFKASQVPLWVMVPHYVSQPKQWVVKNFFFFHFSFICFVCFSSFS